MLLEAPVGPTILRLALPNVAVMVVQASIGLIETYFIAKLGLDALTGVALVFPLFMLLQMVSAGAMGGGILSAIARALGSGSRERANELVWAAVAITIGLGALTTIAAQLFGPNLYALMGGRDGSLAAATTYSALVFAGAIPLWLFNSLLIGIGIALQRLATRTVRSALDRAERELADRKQTEERLKAVTQRLQLALEAGEIGVWDWDLQSNQIVYDNRLFAIYGLRPTADRVVLYQDWVRQVHPEDLPQQESALRHLTANHDRRVQSDMVAHERSRRDFRIIRPDGTMRRVQSAAAVVVDEHGEPMRLVGMNIDVTEQKQAEREREKLVHDLGERVKELRLLHAVARLLQSDRPFNLNLLTELVALLPPAWQYPECCEARIAYAGIEAVTRGWRESAWKQSASFASARGDGIIEVVYMVEKPPEAEGPFLAEERTLIESLAEMLEAYLEHRQDVEALTRREAEFRSIFEHAALGLALVDSERHVVACNPALEVFLGYTKDELGKMRFTDFTHAEDVAIDGELYRSLVAGQRTHYQMEKRYLRKDGNVVWGRLTVSLVQGSSPQYAIGMVEDVWVMMVAMVIAMVVMLFFSHSIAQFVSRNPTIKVLALSFLILIGVLLVAEGLGQHIDKGYVYFAMAFAVGIELINMRLRPKPPADPDKLA
jgi:PAS domain S-box-containing protein